jgi:anhydro-N-acetylmuramic acid kinase
MAERKSLSALGLMSGTSLDGIDAAVVETDGERVLGFGPAATYPYDDGFRERLRLLLGSDPDAGDPTVGELTRRHAEAVKRLLADHGLERSAIGVIGFHGHTVLHDPARGITRQVGDGAGLAWATGIPVVADFRSDDVAAGGQGAPLAPLFHRALAEPLAKPLAVLNVGGVANVTYLGPRPKDGEGAILAFDTGPGNALIDDWTLRTRGRPFDADGRLARAGRVDEALLALLLRHPYFERPPPKSLDRGQFDAGAAAGLSAEDGAATLTAFTAAAVAKAARFLPEPPRRWLVSGGGRRNGALMQALARALSAPVEPVEACGWRGDSLEAEAFAFLAVRSLGGLPLSLPSTTGVPRPTSGGTLHRPPGRRG